MRRDSNEIKLPAVRCEWPASYLVAVEMLALPRNGGLLLKEVADKCGFTERHLRRLRRHPAFMEAVKERAFANARAELPTVLDALTAKASKGDVKAIALYLQMNGMLKTEIDVTARPGEPDRSNAAIEADIQRLRRELGLSDDDETDDQGDVIDIYVTDYDITEDDE